MKPTIVMCALLTILVSLTFGQSTRVTPAERREKEALLKLTNDITAAKTKRDIAALDRLLADDYTLTNPAGFVADKAEYLDGAKADTATYESVSNSDASVRLYGGAAVVTGATLVKGSYDGHDIGGQFRFTHVFVKKQDR